MKTRQELRNDIPTVNPKDAPGRMLLQLFLMSLAEFLFEWFFTDEGDRKPFWKAMLTFLSKDFWKDLTDLKIKLDQLTSEL